MHHSKCVRVWFTEHRALASSTGYRTTLPHCYTPFSAALRRHYLQVPYMRPRFLPSVTATKMPPTPYSTATLPLTSNVCRHSPRTSWSLADCPVQHDGHSLHAVTIMPAPPGPPFVETPCYPVTTAVSTSLTVSQNTPPSSTTPPD